MLYRMYADKFSESISKVSKFFQLGLAQQKVKEILRVS